MLKRNILDLDMQQLELLAKDFGFPEYRGRQIFKWLGRGVVGFDDMTNLPRKLIEILDRGYYPGISEVVMKKVSDIDGTTKYLLKLIDGSLIECVLLLYDYGRALCISSQVGCRMGCGFCASTRGGLVRDLTPGEMVGQVHAAQRDCGDRISNIVVMGSGEPLDNYDNVLRFIKIINAKEGLNIGLRHITVSTCGLVPQIERLAEEGLPVTLSVSLHAAEDETRKRLMPVALKYKIEDIIKSCKVYISKTGRRVTFEYSVIQGVNDSTRDADKLAARLAGLLCHVNIIPVNPIEGAAYNPPDHETVDRFKDVLAGKGISVTVRRELGRDIDGACGQLKAGYRNHAYGKGMGGV